MNTFQNAIQCIAKQNGLDSELILSSAQGLSSADFCIKSNAQSMSTLPDVVAEELLSRYDLYSQGPFNYRQFGAKENSMVFIPNKMTEKLMAEELISERFENASRLYQYLNWTIRISKVAQLMVLLESENGCNVVLVHTELHDQRQRDLYGLCVANDMVSAKAQKWQLAALMTAPELVDLLGIDHLCFPYGVRSSSQHFREYRQITKSHSMVDALKDIKDGIKKMDSKGKDVRYQQMKCVQTNGRRTNEDVPLLKVRLSTFCKLVRETLEDDKVALYPLVSIVSKKHRKKRTEDFSIDYLLPVQVGQDWVGVVYRDGVPTQALMDHYDITNKTILCNPSCDITALNMFQNPRYQRLRILPDLETNSIDAESVCSAADITDSRSDIAESVESTPNPSMFEMSPSVSAVPSMSILPRLNRVTLSLTSSLSTSTSLGSEVSTWDLPALSLTASNSSALPPLPVTPMPMVLPIPNMPITFGVSGTDQLLQWTNQILVNGIHNLGQFEQYLVPRESKQ